MRVLTPCDSGYPRRLWECVDAPLVLYARGEACLNARRVVSVVGTRRCTRYGQDLIHSFVHRLKELCPEVLVVSGLAAPEAMPAAFLMSSAAGGVFVMKVNVRSS